MENQTKSVVMTAEEQAEFAAFKAEKEKKAAEQKAQEQRQTYRQMVDDEIAAAIPELKGLSDDIKVAKDSVLENFKAILAIKGEMFNQRHGKDMNFYSHTFTNSEGTKKITIGQYMNDNYLDTAENGIQMITEYIQSLATDAKSQALVGMVMKLLAKDAKGTLKAQRIIQLRKIADQTGDEKFIQGVKIIEEAYSPLPSKTFVRAWEKDEKTNAWKPIPLGMTES